MSRVLLTWELGLNLGHLARLAPIAQRLKADGHTVLLASRDVQAAAAVFGPLGIPFVQAPHLPKGIALAHRACGYADILLAQGWSDRSALWGLTHSWLNLFRLFRPDRLVLDYSPTVSLAGRIADIPAVLVGNGFEIPPATDPLPEFPGFSWATPEKAANSEKAAVTNANEVLRAFGQPPIGAFRDLIGNRSRLLLTVPELDHYDRREAETYVGPLTGGVAGAPLTWTDALDSPKVFACLRPDTSNVTQILQALASSPWRVILVAMGFIQAQLAPYLRPHIQIASGPVDLSGLLDADLCLSYGAEGTMMRFLQAGVPQIIAPWHVEAFIVARKIGAAGAGTSLAGCKTAQEVSTACERTLTDPSIRESAVELSKRLHRFPQQAGIDAVIDALSPHPPDASLPPRAATA